MDTLRLVLSDLSDFDITLFTLGDVELTLFTLLKLIVLLWLLVFATRRFTAFIERRIASRPNVDASSRLAIVAVIRYTLIIVGTVVILQIFGIRLTAFAVLAGAVGVGVGFGLQQIISNFISGLIIMFERPIKVGDRIELSNLEGNVTEIGMRRTTVVTNDNIAILVPNSRFITDNVVNLRYHADHIRVRISVLVAASADAAAVDRLLLEVAKENKDVLADPPPVVRLLALSAGGNMAFELQVWNSTCINTRDALVSALNFAIRSRLTASGIAFA